MGFVQIDDGRLVAARDVPATRSVAAPLRGGGFAVRLGRVFMGLDPISERNLMESHMTTQPHVLPTSGSQPALLGIYLNDHLAGAAAGVALAQRLADSHRNTAASDDLAWIAEQVTADRASLLQMMSQLHILRTRYKEPLALLAERAGRLKPNGHLRSRSPLSSLVELEAMAQAWRGRHRPGARCAHSPTPTPDLTQPRWTS